MHALLSHGFLGWAHTLVSRSEPLVLCVLHPASCFACHSARTCCFPVLAYLSADKGEITIMSQRQTLTIARGLLSPTRRQILGVLEDTHNLDRIEELPPPNPEVFATFLNGLMGFR